DLVDRDTMLARLDSYMKQVFEWLTENEYIDMIYAYDIANECWMENGSMRDSFWLKTIGEDYLYQTFKIARKYAPETVDLYYNDYNEQYKTDTFVKFIESMKDEDGNYLLDGIGFQAHLYTKDDMKTYFKTLDTISALGLKVQLTELDVCLGKYQGYLKATTENLLVQGKYMYDLIAGIFERVDNGTLNSDALTFWGFKDDLSWRKDGSPLLMDKSMNPKPAFFGALQMKEEVGY
ncbi:MAG: endo-1,4-beta-xylanase, partial [Lachnospiraceae bacterium]|nr:endo-1,4-beta-xylanase [Lachnospiraceae bacterium]